MHMVKMVKWPPTLPQKQSYLVSGIWEEWCGYCHESIRNNNFYSPDLFLIEKESDLQVLSLHDFNQFFERVVNGI